MKNIAIIGSTGSIGKKTLQVARKNKIHFRIVGLATRSNITLLEKQAREFKPDIVSVWDTKKADILKKRLRRSRIRVVAGKDGLKQIATLHTAQQIIFALNGIDGLVPLFDAIKCKKDIAIANKELIVISGALIEKAVQRYKVNFVPIDSEHSAIFQCLQGQKRSELKKIILTASGGPFVDMKRGKLSRITPERALRHPRWKMGRKITIDSATLMNKGLELIEASYLYNVVPQNIDVVIHRESIIHSFVEFIDGSMLAQLSQTDMCFPIAFALSYPDRLVNTHSPLHIAQLKTLRFEKPRCKDFPCIGLAYRAIKRGYSMPIVLNAANDVAVEAFLRRKICFTDIPKVIKAVMDRHKLCKKITLSRIVSIHKWAQEEAEKLC